MISKRLLAIDHFFNFVTSKIHLSYVNPVNAKTEERKFFKTKKDPKFRYKIADDEFFVLGPILSEIELDHAPVEHLLAAKKKELQLRYKLILAMGTDKFTSISKQLYPAPSNKLVSIAKKILALPPSERPKKIQKVEAVKMLRSAFKILGIRWKIKNEPIVASAMVSNPQKTLVLKTREKFSGDYVKRLIVHEIGTHAARNENGTVQPLRMFRYGFANYLETEEGLAAYNEFRAGLMTNSILRNYAGRTLAVHYALNHSFSATYNLLSKYFKPKTAWKLTLRAKRGLGNTRKPGAFTKDVSYLRGFLKVYEFSKNHDVRDLYVGKVSITDLPHLKEIPKIQKPKYTPHVFFDREEFTHSDRAITEEDLQSILK